MNNCPCCGTNLLRHINRDRQYLFCRYCWQEMPNFDSLRMINYRQTFKVNKLPSLPKFLLIEDTLFAIDTGDKSHVFEEQCEGKL